jgi:hypothetical protein
MAVKFLQSPQNCKQCFDPFNDLAFSSETLMDARQKLRWFAVFGRLLVCKRNLEQYGFTVGATEKGNANRQT